MRLRKMTRSDWPQALALNHASVEDLSKLDYQRLEWIASLARCGFAVEGDGQVVAFAIAIEPGTAYDSQNYGWFNNHYEQFFYLDRVVVAEPFRRLGIATQLYDAMEAVARPYGRMVCDVGVEPPNQPSLAFHAARGYVEVGRLNYGSEKVVALLSKDL